MKKNGGDSENLIKELVKLTFQSFDSNGSGFLGKAEFRKLMDEACRAQNQPTFSDNQLENMMEHLDVNKDGLLDIDEVTTVIKPSIHQLMNQ